MSAARIVIALAAATAGGLVSAAPAQEAKEAPLSRPIASVTLRNADFEAPPQAGRDCPPAWWCTMHNDVTSFKFSLATESGARGKVLKITHVRKEPWAVASQAVPIAEVKGKRMRVTVLVQTQAVEGKAGPVVMIQGPGGRALADAKTLLPRGKGWTKAVVEIDVPANADSAEIGLYMEGGGWAAFDDVQAAVVPPPGT
ncbi:MAG: hypothetical protein OEX21_12310 [Betaproteobacteria bacterium]|nr:hypothetical protein [Betaproteobacteria bacterium]